MTVRSLEFPCAALACSLVEGSLRASGDALLLPRAGSREAVGLLDLRESALRASASVTLRLSGESSCIGRPVPALKSPAPPTRRFLFSYPGNGGNGSAGGLPSGDLEKELFPRGRSAKSRDLT